MLHYRVKTERAVQIAQPFLLIFLSRKIKALFLRLLNLKNDTHQNEK